MRRRVEAEDALPNGLRQLHAVAQNLRRDIALSSPGCRFSMLDEARSYVRHVPGVIIVMSGNRQPPRLLGDCAFASRHDRHINSSPPFQVRPGSSEVISNLALN